MNGRAAKAVRRSSGWQRIDRDRTLAIRQLDALRVELEPARLPWWRRFLAWLRR